MSAYKVIVCGQRDYDDRDRLYEVLDAYLARIGPKMLVINGGAPGADTLAREWAVDRKVDHLTLYAKWDLYGRSAGPIRNARMAKKKPRRVLAFYSDYTNSRGTRDMIKKAKAADIKYKEFK